MDNSRFDHFVVQIVSFSGSFSDSGENGIPSVFFGDIVNQFLNEHGFSDSGSSEESNFTSSRIGSHQIDNFNTGDQNLLSRF